MILFDRLGKFSLFRFRQIVVARNWLVVLIFARTAGDDIKSRTGIFRKSERGTLHERLLQSELPARLDEACSDGGDAEILVCPQERHPLPHRKRERAVVFEKDDALVGDIFGNGFVFSMLTVVRTALCRRQVENAWCKLFALFIAETGKFDRISFPELARYFPHGSKINRQRRKIEFDAFPMRNGLAVHRHQAAVRVDLARGNERNGVRRDREHRKHSLIDIGGIIVCGEKREKSWHRSPQFKL